MPKLRKHKIAGAILAGGNAFRMGGIAKGAMKTDKGISIAEHLIGEFQLAGLNPIVILANDPRPYSGYGAEIFEDIRTGIGPLGGIETALAGLADRCDAVLFVPCDMPNITVKEILTLKEAFVTSESLAVYAETCGFFWHPLCAVVHNDLLGKISSAIDRGQKTVHDLWRQLGAAGVRFAEEAAFVNINTFSDAKRWQESRT